jgi:RNA polymerase sigma-B factor
VSTTRTQSHRVPQLADEIVQSLIDCDPGTLLTTLVALPPGHPSRPTVRDRAIEAWLPLAHHLAHRYGSRSEPIDDLCQVAAMGLIKAVDRFDPRVGGDFPAFAVPTITGEIKRHFRDRTWHLHVRRGVKDRLADLRLATEELQHLLHRSPTTAEIAEHLEISEAEVRDSMCAAQAYRSTSLEGSRDSAADLELCVALGEIERGYDLVEHRPALAAALARLDPRSREVIRLRFLCDLSQQQIAERVGVSQMQISRILTRTLNELREALDVVD